MRKAIELKQQQIKELIDELSGAKIVAIVSLEGIPTNQLNRIRKELGLNLKVATKNVFKRALEKFGKGFEKLVGHFKGSCGLLLLDDSAFRLSIRLAGLREPAFVKPGMVAEADIIIGEGPTALMPGEGMTALTDLGVKVSPKGGKVTVLEPATLVKAGEVVSKKVAELLYDLGVKPVTTGLSIVAAFEDKSVFTHDQLSVNVQEILNNLGGAHVGALNVAYEAGVVNQFTVELLLIKGASCARNLAREAGILTKDNVDEFIFTANAKALVLASTIKWEVPE